MNKEFIIYYPYKCFPAYIHIHHTFKDLYTFYENLKQCLTELYINYTIITSPEEFMSMIEVPDKSKIYLGYDIVYKFNDNVWCVKTSYLHGYVYVDPYGVGKNSYLAKHKSVFDKSQTLDFEESKNCVLEYIDRYKKTNLSRFPQPTILEKLDFKYFFFPYQNWRNDQLILKLADYLYVHDYKLVVKYHPKTRQRDYTLPDHKNIIIKNNSIHDLLPNTQGVLTIDSAVGFEALLYNKHVFTFGNIDYNYVAHQITNNLQNIIPLSKLLINEEMNYKFIYYMMNSYWVDVMNKEKIKERIIKMFNGDKL